MPPNEVRMTGLKTAALLLALSIPGISFGASADGGGGVWRNPQNSVHVEVRHCGTGMCGTVVWANEKDIADAGRGGTEKLIGLQLFRVFVQDRKGVSSEERRVGKGCVSTCSTRWSTFH